MLILTAAVLPSYASCCRYPDLQLFSTVFHVWGKLNRTFDRNAQGENLLDYFDQYVKWTDPSKPNFLQVGVLACIHACMQSEYAGCAGMPNSVWCMASE